MSAPVIGHDEVLRLVATRNALLVDALPGEDYKRLHLPRAVNIPIQEFNREHVQNIDRARPVITYCADLQCDLSARAAARFVQEGFAEVYEFGGGIAEWGAFGLKFEGDDADIARSGDLAQHDVPRCLPDDSAAGIAFGEHAVAVVVDAEGVLLGRIQRNDAEARPDLRARDAMSPKMSTFRPDVHIAEMGDWFRKRPRATEFVITTPDGRVVGVLYRSVVENVLNGVRARAAAT
jgi:rhodanese-related sulfurtransferase